MSTELAVLEPQAVVRQFLPPCPIAEAEIQSKVEAAKSVSITDVESLKAGNATIADLGKTIKALDAWIKDPKETANKIHKAVLAEYNERAKPLATEVDRLKKEKVSYEAAVRRANEEAARAVKAGEIEEWMAEQVALPVSDEVSTRSTGWKVAVRDWPTLYRWLADNWANAADLVDAEPSAVLKAKAKSMGKDLEKMIPGIEVYQGETAVVR